MGLRRLGVGCLLATLGCLGTVRIYPTPITPTEGELLVPALLTASNQLGLRGWRGISGAVVQLEDGTYLNWQDSIDHRDFHLAITLPGGIPEPELPARFDAAKGRADQIWNTAIEARRGAMVAPPPAYPTAQPPPPPPPSGGVQLNVPGFSLNIGGAAAPPTGCLLGSDGVQACGYGCRIGSDGRANCAATPDGTCELNTNGTVSCGRACQLTSSGFYVCQ